MCHASVPGALNLEAIKLNKENNTSDVTLVNYFLRISSMFCVFPIFWMEYLAYHSSLNAFFIIIVYQENGELPDLMTLHPFAA